METVSLTRAERVFRWRPLRRENLRSCLPAVHPTTLIPLVNPRATADALVNPNLADLAALVTYCGLLNLNFHGWRTRTVAQ